MFRRIFDSLSNGVKAAKYSFQQTAQQKDLETRIELTRERIQEAFDQSFNMLEEEDANFVRAYLFHLQGIGAPDVSNVRRHEDTEAFVDTINALPIDNQCALMRAAISRCSSIALNKSVQDWTQKNSPRYAEFTSI